MMAHADVKRDMKRIKEMIENSANQVLSNADVRDS
jgi:hypothetical protein